MNWCCLVRQKSYFHTMGLGQTWFDFAAVRDLRWFPENGCCLSPRVEGRHSVAVMGLWSPGPTCI